MSRFTPCELKAMASESDMGTPLRIIFLVKGGWQEGRSSPLFHRDRPTRPRMTGDWFLMSVGVWRAGMTPGTTNLTSLSREFVAPQLGERVELKVGWPTVKVPFVMVWGCRVFLSLFFYCVT